MVLQRALTRLHNGLDREGRIEPQQAAAGFRRLKHYALQGLGYRLSGVEACKQLFAPIFADRREELFLVALVADDCKLIELLTIGGDAQGVEIGVAEIFRAVVLSGAKALILAHNHPSGDIRPSRSDKVLTSSMAIACEALDISLCDHLIFGGNEVFSFRQHGYL